MNVHPYFFRMAIRNDFSRDEYARFMYSEGIYHGFHLVRPNSQPFINYEHGNTDALETIAITYRDDGMIALNWVQVTYLKSDHLNAKLAFEKIVARLKEKVPTYSLTELQQMYRDTSTDEDGHRLFAVYATAVNAPWEYDAAYFAAIQEYTKDSKATVRAGVVIGIGYIGQTEYLPILEELAQDDSADVQQRAQDMLESFAALSEKR